MKKTLLSLMVITSFSVGAQVIETENFNSLNLGVIGTDMTGETPGQGDYSTLGGLSTDYTILNAGGTYGNALQLKGSSNATGARYLFKEGGLYDAWMYDADVANEIVEVEFDINPLAASTSLNSFRVYLYGTVDFENIIVLGGMGVAKTLNVGTTAAPNMMSNVIQGFLHWTSTPGTGTYSIGLGETAATSPTTPNDTWVRIGFSVDTSTGLVTWKGPGFDVYFEGNDTFPLITGGGFPYELDFVAATATGNTVSATSLIDNVVVKATSEDTLLSTTNNILSRVNDFSVYPNPANDLITVSTYDHTINSVEIVDINGRTIKNLELGGVNNAQINISDLASGVYMLNIAFFIYPVKVRYL
jgi:hypothetical protein